MNDHHEDPYEWNPADQGTDRPEQREDRMTTDLEQARKMLVRETNFGSVIHRISRSRSAPLYKASINPTEHTGIHAYGDSPADAGKKAIEMYRLVKYGPEVVEQMRSLRSLIESLPEDSMGGVSHADGSGHWIRDEVIDRINKSLAHFPQENSNGLAE